MGNNGVRKGAWTKEEDTLLKKCIQMYGEGNWHKVPPRAGLNRCRKSCRLRWLNYLRPNLKRGFFTKDEIDLLLRLHKLLGNRWSLIAGRLPGRTGNDVKNFWNTHIIKKSSLATESRNTRQVKMITENNIIKPRPRTFSKLHLPVWSSQLNKTNETSSKDQTLENNMKASSSSASLLQEEANDHWKNGEEICPVNNQPFSFSEEDVDECVQWWSNLLETTESGEGIPFSDQDHAAPIMQSDQANNLQINKDGLSTSLSVDDDVWRFLGFD